MANYLYAFLRVVHMSGDAMTAGIETVDVAGVSVRMFGVAKTVADCFRFRNKIGLDVALEALNEAWSQRRVNMDELLTKYALERLLYRLSVSPWGDAFVLKGALLFDLWFDQPHRPTRDMDLLGFGSAEIRKEANYAGVRVTLLGMLDGARCAVQIDVGYGDAVTPEPQSASYPVLLADMSAPVLRVYPAYTVVAEKYHAMVSLEMVNTRLKDYFDLWFLARHFSFEPTVLQDAIAATFSRRSTPLPQHCHWVCQMPLLRTPPRCSNGRHFCVRTNCKHPPWRP